MSIWWKHLKVIVSSQRNKHLWPITSKPTRCRQRHVSHFNILAGAENSINQYWYYKEEWTNIFHATSIVYSSCRGQSPQTLRNISSDFEGHLLRLWGTSPQTLRNISSDFEGTSPRNLSEYTNVAKSYRFIKLQ